MTFSNCRCSSPWDSRTSELISRSVMNCWFAGLPLASMASASGGKSDPCCLSSSGIHSRFWDVSSGISLSSVNKSPIFYIIVSSNAVRFWDSDLLDVANSLGKRQQSDQHGITCPFICRITWHILLPSFRVGPKQRPNTSIWNGNLDFVSQK